MVVQVPNSGALNRCASVCNPAISIRVAFLYALTWYGLATISEPGTVLGVGHKKMKDTPFHLYSSGETSIKTNHYNGYYGDEYKVRWRLAPTCQE